MGTDIAFPHGPNPRAEKFSKIFRNLLTFGFDRCILAGTMMSTNFLLEIQRLSFWRNAQNEN